MAKSNTANMDFFEKVGYTFGLINESWEAFKLNWSTFVLIWLMPLLLFLLLIPLLVLPAITNNDVITATTVLVAAIGFLLAFAILVILIPALTVTQIASVKGQKLGFEQAFNQSKSFVWRFVVAAVLGFLIIMGPLLLALPLILVIVGIFLVPLAMLWAFIAPFFLLLVPYIIVSENLSATESISRSYELTKKHWQWILAVYIVILAVGVATNLLGIIPIIGWVVSIGLFLAYYCLPAYIYVTEVSAKDKTSNEATKKPAKAKSTKKK